MRPLYFLLKILLFIGIKLFFRKIKIINPPKKFNAQTIFVVNHASAFLDPWVIAELQKPVLFFLARGDIFKRWLRPITWAAHMIPIYRTKENGADSAEKNEAIFKEVYGLLKKKKSILIFGEGYTDDVFIRSLKPLKKGPARIGFGAMEATNWKEDIKIQSTGINYQDPNEFRADVLVSNSESIRLKDYKELYLENPSKAILEVTKKVTENLQDQLTYLEDAKLTDFHNHIQSITKKGLAYENSDRSIALEDRWQYSQNLAGILNENYDAQSQKWQTLKKALADYFSGLRNDNIDDNWVLNFSNGRTPNFVLRFLVILFGLPLFLLGFAHHYLPYIVVKNFAEKTFKRRVFWSGIKLILGYFVLASFNIALCFIINAYFDIMHPGLLWIYVIAIVPLFGLFAYWYGSYFKSTLALLKIKNQTYEKWAKMRSICASLVESTLPK